MYEDKDNDGKFPDESPVEAHYPARSRNSRLTVTPGHGCRVPS
jgi:hypothetical protein